MRSHGFLSVRRDPDAGKAEVPRFAPVETHSGGAAVSDPRVAVADIDREAAFDCRREKYRVSNKIKITNVQDLLKYLPEIAPADKPRSHIRFMFRGQRDATWKLHPGVYRSTFNVKDEDETARLNRERNLMKDFRAFSAGLRTVHESLADLYLLQQHYRMPTRLLDWTNNALAALFFAVTTCTNAKQRRW
jgi:hypothetical protein